MFLLYNSNILSLFIAVMSQLWEEWAEGWKRLMG